MFFLYRRGNSVGVCDRDQIFENKIPNSLQTVTANLFS